MSNSNRFFTLTRLLVGVAVGLAACGGDDSDTSGPAPSDDAGPTESTGAPTESTAASTADGTVEDATVNWALSSDPGSLDPHHAYVNVNAQMAPFAYDSLVYRDEHGDIVSGLAESWEDQGLDGITVTLREGITCSDGSLLTASDVARNFEYVGNPENGSSWLGAFVPESPSVTADDDSRTVTITPNEPHAFFLESLASFPIVCAAALDDREMLAEATHGTGPYELTDVQPGSQWTYTRRDDYRWGPDGASTDAAGLPKTVIFKIVENETTVTNQLISGEINVAEVTGPERERLENEALFSDTYPTGIAQMFFNQMDGRLGAEEHIRRAVVMGTDLAQLSSIVTSGFGGIADGLTYLEPRICPADTVTPYLPSYDPAGARALLEQNGWTEGSSGFYERDGQRLSLGLSHLTDNPGYGAGAEYMAAQLKEIGVELTPNPGTTETLGPVIFGSGDYDITWLPISRNMPTHLTQLFQPPTPPDGLDFAYISNPEYDRLVDEAVAKLDTSGCPEWEAAEVALIERVDVVPFAATDAPVWGSGVRFYVGGPGIVQPMSLQVVDG